MTESELAEVYKLASLGRMLAGVIHEISTPVSSLASDNETLRRSLETLAGEPLSAKGARALEALRAIADTDRLACERIAAIVRSAKTLARSGPEPSKADVNQLLRDALRLAHHEYRQRVRVETDFGDLPEIECRPDLLDQVFLNVLVNAAQAIEGEGRVTVRTRFEDGRAHIAVSDTGRGIEPAAAGRIFSFGFSTKPSGSGGGLGLAISKRIIEAHGGAIDFESGPAGGTTFHIRLPLQPPPGALEELTRGDHPDSRDRG